MIRWVPVKSLMTSAVFAVSVGLASAATVDVNKQASNIFNDNAYGSVRIQEPDVRPTATNVHAGGFALTSSVLGDFVAFCLDIGTTIFSSGPVTYHVTDKPFEGTTGTLGDQAINWIKRLFDAYYDPAAMTNVLNDKTMATASQVALWKLVYGDSLVTSHYKPSGAASLSDSWVTFVKGDSDIGRVWQLTFLESLPDEKGTRYQNLVTVTPVPLPAAIWFLLSAFGGLGILVQRRTRQARITILPGTVT